MSEEKQASTDLATEEKVASTWLARGLGVLVLVLVIPMLVGVFMLLSRFRFFAMVSMFVSIPLGVLLVRLSYQIHDSIARHQHHRRQRVLRSQDDQAVPDTAISRAQPPSEPAPTDAALSLANGPDETEHLSVSIEEDTQAVVDDTT